MTVIHEMIYLCLFLHIITTVLLRLMPTVDKFLKAVMKELHTLFLYPGRDSSFHLTL